MSAKISRPRGDGKGRGAFPATDGHGWNGERRRRGIAVRRRVAEGDGTTIAPDGSPGRGCAVACGDSRGEGAFRTPDFRPGPRLCRPLRGLNGDRSPSSVLRRRSPAVAVRRSHPCSSVSIRGNNAVAVLRPPPSVVGLPPLPSFVRIRVHPCPSVATTPLPSSVLRPPSSVSRRCRIRVHPRSSAVPKPFVVSLWRISRGAALDMGAVSGYKGDFIPKRRPLGSAASWRGGPRPDSGPSRSGAWAGSRTCRRRGRGPRRRPSQSGTTVAVAHKPRPLSMESRRQCQMTKRPLSYVTS